jgi:hypothetical protein
MVAWIISRPSGRLSRCRFHAAGRRVHSCHSLCHSSNMLLQQIHPYCRHNRRPMASAYVLRYSLDKCCIDEQDQENAKVGEGKDRGKNQYDFTIPY